MPHLARDGTVKLGHPIRVRGGAERERRQPEGGVPGMHLPELRELLPVEAAAIDQVSEVLPDELWVEDLVAGRHGRVRGEDRRRADLLERVVALGAFRLDELAETFELEERRVPLVHVEDGRREAKRAKHADAADAEDELLPEAVEAVAPVER